MKASTWALFRAGIIASMALGASLAAAVFIAFFVIPIPGTIGVSLYALVVGLVVGLAHGLIAAAGGAFIRRFPNGHRWTSVSAAGAVLVAWLIVISIALAAGTSTVVMPLVITAASATVITAGAAQLLIRRLERSSPVRDSKASEPAVAPKSYG